MRRGYLCFVLLVSCFASVSALTSDDMTVHLRFLNASGQPRDGTWSVTFNISTSLDCKNVTYSNTATLTPNDSSNTYVYRLPAVSGVLGDHYLCVYRNNTLEVACDSTGTCLNGTPFTRGSTTSAQNVLNDSDLNLSRRNISAGNGWFDRLWDGGNRVCTAANGLCGTGTITDPQGLYQNTSTHNGTSANFTNYTGPTWFVVLTNLSALVNYSQLNTEQGLLRNASSQNLSTSRLGFLVNTTGNSILLNGTNNVSFSVLATQANATRTYLNSSDASRFLNRTANDYSTGSIGARSKTTTNGAFNAPATTTIAGLAIDVNGNHRNILQNWYSTGGGVNCGHKLVMDDLLNGDMWWESGCSGARPHIYFERDANYTIIGGNTSPENMNTIWGGVDIENGNILMNYAETDATSELYFESPNCQGASALILGQAATDSLKICTSSTVGYFNTGQPATTKAAYSIALATGVQTTGLVFAQSSVGDFGWQYAFENSATGDAFFQRLTGVASTPSNVTTYTRATGFQCHNCGRSFANETMTVQGGVRAKNLTLETDALTYAIDFVGTLSNTTNATIRPCNMTFNVTHVIKIRVNNQDAFLPISTQPINTDCG